MLFIGFEHALRVLRDQSKILHTECFNAGMSTEHAEISALSVAM